MCPIMATIFNKIINSLYAFLPWGQNSNKRLRDESSDENEENINVGVTPPKRQRLHRPPFRQKVLNEMNPPNVTTVEPTFKAPLVSKLQIGDNGKPPKHVSSPIKLRRRLAASTPIASIDLTEHDDCRSAEDLETISHINPTKSGPSCSVRRRPVVVDLTGPGNDKMTSPVKASRSPSCGRPKELELYRKKTSNVLPPKVKDKSRSIVSVDLTSPTAVKPAMRKKRVSIESSCSKPVAVIDLEERNSYGRVLGSMLEGKIPAAPQMKSPPIKPGILVDLTSDDDEDIDVTEIKVNPSSSKNDSKNSIRYVTSLPVIEINEDSSVLSTSPKNGTRSSISRVNSFEVKLKDHPCTHQDWVVNLMKDYEETQKSFIETRDQYYKEAAAWSDENRRAVEEILEKKLERHLKITEALITETPEEKYAPIIKPLPTLSKAAELKIKGALVRSPEYEVLIEKFNLKITRRDIQTLNGLNWLNDEVINFYMQLLEDRAQKNERYPPIHTFSTFFYAGLQSRGHSGMKRWTKKVNIFEKQLIIIPIHLHMHWCLIVVDLMKKEINYYDSMGHDNNECLRHISNYLIAEHEVKQSSLLDLIDWKVQNIKNIPQQMNGSDCGIFACTYAEYCSRRAPFDFDQSKMQYFRRKMIYEIITGQLL
ncbi:sentrin-specific protease 1 isoform X3 [Halyomorpha halys]|uniref:sentrin-specific protease 1 isoform X3 n=1 Tax=Halyomorpha halys TaxID=286706 RepID=UPI0006D4F453|nr:sentrin-specific protease 1-like isoform X3 [Halyomorpha halys]